MFIARIVVIRPKLRQERNIYYLTHVSLLKELIEFVIPRGYKHSAPAGPQARSAAVKATGKRRRNVGPTLKSPQPA
jgi:hypothetical protein